MPCIVNEIVGNHNVDKQISDSKGDVAYMMADVSDVGTDDLKEISESLEALSCKWTSQVWQRDKRHANHFPSAYHGPYSVLRQRRCCHVSA
jgi:hypothetical protein